MNLILIFCKKNFPLPAGEDSLKKRHLHKKKHLCQNILKFEPGKLYSLPSDMRCVCGIWTCVRVSEDALDFLIQGNTYIV